MKIAGEAKLLLIMGALVLAGVGTLAGINMLGNGAVKIPLVPTPAPTPTPVAWTPEKFDALVKNAAHVRGDANAPLTVVEFADFECPSCRHAYNLTLSKWEKEKRPVRIVFHHFPLPSVHPRALPAAYAAEAAGRQAKFWPMYDALFTGEETELTDDYILESANKIGLDMPQFQKDWRNEAALKPLVDADQALGTANGVTSTPTFMVKDKTGKIQTLVGSTQLAAFSEGKPIPPLSPR